MKRMTSHPIIFTDLDGTLLDHETYAFTEALPALDLVRAREIPLIFCSSKTRVEIEYWRERLQNDHPFISENGGGIFIPPSYFPAGAVKDIWPTTEGVGGCSVLLLGKPYAVLRDVLLGLRDEGFEIRGFGDMTAEEISKTTGLSLDQAELAKKRDFDEPFFFYGEERKRAKLLASIGERGFRYSQGKFYHLMGENDKGKAVDILRTLYERKVGDIATIALGDSPVDFPMLERVDYPVLVRNYKGEHDPRITLPNLMKVDGMGPKGWNQALLMLLHERM
jgi:mannosyl-3-phosphoglycerate phosphatase